jgi:hypothetical protein
MLGVPGHKLLSVRKPLSCGEFGEAGCALGEQQGNRAQRSLHGKIFPWMSHLIVSSGVWSIRAPVCGKG